MKSKRSLQLLFAGVVIASPFTLHSQQTNSPAKPAAAVGQNLFLAGLGPIGNVLTEEQRASFRQAMDAQREKIRDNEIKLRDARKKFFDASVTAPFDEATVRKQAQAVATLEAEATVIRAKAVSQIQPPLSNEQIEKIKNSFAGPRNAPALQPAAERQHHLTSTNRDENDLPPKR